MVDGALPHRAPSPRFTAESMHHVWPRCCGPSTTMKVRSPVGRRRAGPQHGAPPHRAPSPRCTAESMVCTMCGAGGYTSYHIWQAPTRLFREKVATSAPPWRERAERIRYRGSPIGPTRKAADPAHGAPPHRAPSPRCTAELVAPCVAQEGDAWLPSRVELLVRSVGAPTAAVPRGRHLHDRRCPCHRHPRRELERCGGWIPPDLGRGRSSPRARRACWGDS